MTNQISAVQILAALSATNEAVLRTTSREALYQRVCDAAVDGGKFLGTGVLVADSDNQLRYVAGAGSGMNVLQGSEISADPSSAHGRGLAGIAFRTGRSCISDDYLNDERVRPWLEQGKDAGIGAAAAVPIVKSKSSVGVLVFFFEQSGFLNDQVVGLIERMAENVSFGLELFDRKDEQNRLARMFAALNATNEAIMRAQTRTELFQLVCEAAVNGAKFTTTSIGLAEPDGETLHLVAAMGPNSENMRNFRFSSSASRPEGRGVAATAFRTGHPCISNDYLAEKHSDYYRNRAQAIGAKSAAGLPLISRGQTVGMIGFMSEDRDTFTPEFIKLLERLARNVSFALENFDRADDKARADERITYLATHDVLTGLPNRGMFSQLLNTSIAAAQRYNRKFAVLFIDLDRFKVINDSLGHAAGDGLLVEVSKRLRQSVRASDVVARLGGDEFVILLSEIAIKDEVATIARDVLSAVNSPLQLGGHEYRPAASIGISMFPGDGDDEETLTKNADMAMYLAKEEGKNDFRFFSKEIKSQSIERLMLEAGLRHALERNEFTLHYQPKLDFARGKITGLEALLRWNQPDLGVLQPMQFIPLAEETGLIVPIGRWVLETACAQNVAWQREGLPQVSMAVNLSPRQFSDENLLQDIDNALAKSGMPPELLQLEITESMAMQNTERAIKMLDAIQKRGVRIAIDDFGTGYSSMSVMQKFPVDTIKIDRSFVRDLSRNSGDKAIAEAIIAMGKAMGLTVVAEGVETAEQEAFLREHACDEMQGFLFSKAVPGEDIPNLLRLHLVNSPSLQPQESVGLEETEGATNR